jgi:hypothetical protein
MLAVVAVFAAAITSVAAGRPVPSCTILATEDRVQILVTGADSVSICVTSMRTER